MAFTVTFTPVTERATLAGMGYGQLTSIALDSANAYPSGGFSLNGCGIQTILGVSAEGNNTAGVGLFPVWNSQTQKLQILNGALAEFSGTFGAGITLLVLVKGY